MLEESSKIVEDAYKEKIKSMSLKELNEEYDRVDEEHKRLRLIYGIISMKHDILNGKYRSR